ncbi:MAG: response regulator transcription factor [Chloroflexota bacterium]|mgnify:CR=1 FL=1
MANRRVLVVDDDLGVLNALRRAFALDGYDVDVASDGVTALEQAGARPPDLIVLDVMLPDLDGFTVCKRLREDLATPIIMLTARDTVPDRIQGLDRGADDYLVKPFAMDELLARARALLRRAGPDEGRVLEFEDVSLDPRAHQATRAGRLLKLTPREYDLLHLFLRHPQQALTREQICQQVWGFAYEGESNFIDVTIKDLRQKLEIAEEARLIQTVRSHGYVMRRAPE